MDGQQLQIRLVGVLSQRLTDYLDLLELFPATLVRDAGRYTKQDIAKPSH